MFRKTSLPSNLVFFLSSYNTTLWWNGARRATREERTEKRSLSLSLRMCGPCDTGGAGAGPGLGCRCRLAGSGKASRQGDS